MNKLLLIIGAVLLSGCSSVSTVYNGDNLYTVTVRSANEVRANNLAMNKAMKICGHDAFRVDVIKHLSDYQGMNEDQKSLVAEAHQNIGVSKSTTSINDYKVTLQFRCKQLNAERQSIVK